AHLHIIVRAKSGSFREAIARILGEEYLVASTRAQVNSEVTSRFASRLLLVKQNIEEVRLIALHFIKPMHPTNLMEALDEFGRAQPLVGMVQEGQALEEARRVIAELLARNVVLLKFAEEVHVACAEGLSEGRRLEKLDLPGLLAPVFADSGGVAGLRRKLGFTFNFLLRTTREGPTMG
ncbi:hypothetical protein KI387_021605, partial [Taxus chinensis]